MPDLDKWLVDILAIASATAAATIFISSRIDQSLKRTDPEHMGLLERVRRLELWAATKGFSSDGDHHD